MTPTKGINHKLLKRKTLVSIPIRCEYIPVGIAGLVVLGIVVPYIGMENNFVFNKVTKVIDSESCTEFLVIVGVPATLYRDYCLIIQNVGILI